MFTTSISRAVRSTCAASAPSTLTSRYSSVAPSLTAATTAPLRERASHQRRLSSSKASVPPDGAKRSNPSQQAATSSGRVGRRKTKDPLIAIDTGNQAFSKHFPHLPSVPSTQHLHPGDINVSSFFSCHRPISVTTAVPPPATEVAFSKIFDSRLVGNRQNHADVIFTLGNFVENIETNGTNAADGIQWQVVQDGAQSETQHLDGEPGTVTVPVDKIISQYRPFRPPPPPQPFDEPAAKADKPKQKAKARAVAPRPKKKSWSTTITVTEFTDPSGEKTYQAASTPIVRVANPARDNAVSEPEGLPRIPVQQPFLQRMHQRRQTWVRYRQGRTEEAIRDKGEGAKGSMLLISVKRQRKLKMKKHKYKKLMKRTRNLRRRLGKI